MSKVYVILTDIWHLMLGVLTAYMAENYTYIGSLLFPYAFLGIVIPFIIMFVFMAYQVLDDDEPVEKVGDMIEYSMGLIAGLIII